MIRLFAGFLAFGIANLALVPFIYRPVSQLEGPGEAFLHPIFGFAVYVGRRRSAAPGTRHLPWVGHNSCWSMST